MVAVIGPVHKKILLLLALYLLFSVVIVAFDQHGPVPDKTCAICAMSSFLSSAVVQSSFIPEVQLTTQCTYIIDGAPRRSFLATTSGISYRGPPLPISFL
jgi:hypothetical protein